MEPLLAIFCRGGIVERRHQLVKDGDELTRKVASALCQAFDTPRQECYLETAEFREKLDPLLKIGNDVAVFVAGQLDKYASEEPTPRTCRVALQEAETFLEDKLANDKPLLRRPQAKPGVSPQGRRYSSLVDRAGVVGQLWGGKVLGIPNKPGALSSMLALGSLGAGTAYLGSKAYNRLNFTPGEREASEPLWAVIGGAAGMVPGLMMGMANRGSGRSFFFGDVTNALRKHGIEKVAMSNFIPVRQLNNMVNHDPWVRKDLPPSIIAATNAVARGASWQAGGTRPSPVVTPTDFARVASGVGSGYYKGLIGGQMLGALFGVSPEAQKILRQSGAAAGLVKAVVPMIYGGH